MSYKIGALILATSKNRDDWVMMNDTYLYNLTLKTFLLTLDKEHNYIFYIGIDKGDRIFDNETQKREITRFSKAFPNVEFKFMTMENIPKGYVTLMWNKLFEDAYKVGCDYFYQCGDDMEFKTKGWINDSIKVLKEKNDIGLTGPINNNNRILTQAFVSRKHMEIFGWFFPTEIKNWCCDDWYNMVYHPNYLYPLYHHCAENKGGQPRYDIDNNPNFTGGEHMKFQMNVHSLRQKTAKLANSHKALIEKFINKN
jgi:hypothetical protein